MGSDVSYSFGGRGRGEGFGHRVRISSRNGRVSLHKQLIAEDIEQDCVGSKIMKKMDICMPNLFQKDVFCVAPSVSLP